jgi:uncharacterized membrane protein HdeD (DUF308 family)
MKGEKMRRLNKLNMTNDLVTALALICIGLMFIIFQGDIISLAMTAIGVVLIVLGVLDAVRGFTVGGVAKIVFGVLVLAAGWLVVSLALYILGAFLLIAGISQLITVLKIKVKRITLGYITHIMQPIVYILVAICLFFNQGGAISWVFIVSGIFLIVDGIVALIGALDRR